MLISLVTLGTLQCLQTLINKLPDEFKYVGSTNVKHRCNIIGTFNLLIGLLYFL